LAWFSNWLFVCTSCILYTQWQGHICPSILWEISFQSILVTYNYYFYYRSNQASYMEEIRNKSKKDDLIKWLIILEVQKKYRLRYKLRKYGITDTCRLFIHWHTPYWKQHEKEMWNGLNWFRKWHTFLVVAVVLMNIQVPGNFLDISIIIKFTVELLKYHKQG